jgi:hypothetical protein
MGLLFCLGLLNIEVRRIEMEEGKKLNNTKDKDFGLNIIIFGCFVEDLSMFDKGV